MFDPTNSFGQLAVARGLWNSGDHEAALAAFPIAIRLNPNSSLALRLFGLCLEHSNRPAEALEQYRQAVEVDPRDITSHKELRRFLMQRGQLEEARIAWRKALDQDPPDHETWYGYAELCLYLGQEEEFLRTRRELLAKFESTTDPYITERTSRACLLRDASGEELRRIVALAGRAGAVERAKAGWTYPFFQFVQGLADYREGKFTRTITIMNGDAASALGPSPRLVLSMALYRTGQVEGAQKALAEAVASYDWKTKLNNYTGTETVEEGAREAVRVALLGPDGPTGTFTHATLGTLPW